MTTGKVTGNIYDHQKTMSELNAIIANTSRNYFRTPEVTSEVLPNGHKVVICNSISSSNGKLVESG